MNVRLLYLITNYNQRDKTYYIDVCIKIGLRVRPGHKPVLLK